MSVPDEQVIPLKQAATRFPNRPRIETLRRWCIFGWRNSATGRVVKLEHIRLSGRYYTSIEATRRYLEAMQQ
jgi:hypothetical protein